MPLIPVADNATATEILETVAENYRRNAECRIAHEALIEAVR